MVACARKNMDLDLGLTCLQSSRSKAYFFIKEFNGNNNCGAYCIDFRHQSMSCAIVK